MGKMHTMSNAKMAKPESDDLCISCVADKEEEIPGMGGREVIR